MESIRTVDKDGTIRYMNEKGKIHRTDGPAFEDTDGFQSWWINGQRHREDGPARVWPDGEEDYYLHDIGYTKEEWETEVLKRRLKRIKDL